MLSLLFGWGVDEGVEVGMERGGTGRVGKGGGVEGEERGEVEWAGWKRSGGGVGLGCSTGSLTSVSLKFVQFLISILSLEQQQNLDLLRCGCNTLGTPH